MSAILKILSFCLVTFCSRNCVAQIKLNDTFRIEHKSKLKSLTEYIKSNNITYGLITWSSSNWPSTEDDYICYFEKDKQYTIANITAPTFIPEGFPYKLIIKQKNLYSFQRDSLLAVIKPDSAFIFTQSDFNALPDPCFFKTGRNTEGFYSINDASSTFLLKFENGKTTLLSFYAPTYYFDKCYPFVKEFMILRGFINTTGKLHM